MRAVVVAIGLLAAAASPAAAAWPGANGRLVYFTIDDGKAQTRTGPLDLRPSRRITWFKPLPVSLHYQSGYGQWSPSGRRLLFQRVAEGFEIRAPRGRLIRRFGTAPNLWWPSWSPDGRRIVAVDLDQPERRLAILSAEGRLLRRIPLGVKPGGSAAFPRWSPSGRWIVYESGDEGGPYVRRRSASGGGADRILTTGTLPTWAPDGRRIAFARGPDVLTMRADGSHVRRVAASPQRNAAIAGLTFSPDGRTIAFVRQDSRSAHDSSSVVTVPASEGRQRVHRTTERFVSGIDWQPR
jgi:TolB protein